MTDAHIDPVAVLNRTLASLTTASGTAIMSTLTNTAPPELLDNVRFWGKSQVGPLETPSTTGIPRSAEKPEQTAEWNQLITHALDQHLKAVDAEAKEYLRQIEWSFIILCFFIIAATVCFLTAIIMAVGSSPWNAAVMAALGALSKWIGDVPLKIYMEAKKTSSPSINDMKEIKEAIKSLSA